MTSRNVELRGMPEFRAQFDRLTKAMQGDVLMHAVREGAILLDTEMSARAPVAAVNGGELKASITWKSRLLKPTRAVADVGSRVRHAVFQEFGTVHHDPQPFMRPALQQKKAAIINAMREELKKRIESVTRGNGS